MAIAASASSGYAMATWAGGAQYARMPRYDVVVIGGGNAALCAALTARLQGCSVLLLERSDQAWRGGNSKYTRNIRVAHPAGDAVMTGEYLEAELLADLAGVSGEGMDFDLARLAVDSSREAPAWMDEQGIRWQQSMRGLLHLGRTNRFFLGGGKALVNAYYRRAETIGVDVRYEAEATDLRLEGDRCTAVVIGAGAAATEVACAAVVIASGGFEANLEWLREYWGDAVDGFAIRGSSFNDGSMLRRLLDHGAAARGDPRSFHAIAVDARGPRFEGGIVTRVDSVPFSVMLNDKGERFYDEGEDLWPKRYATWGRLIAEQPNQCAYSFYDAQTAALFVGGAYHPQSAPTIAALAMAVGMDPQAVEASIERYNDSVVAGNFDHSRLDDCHTDGLAPPKSHWALRIERPPFYCYKLVPGITFTYLGVGIDRRALIVRSDGTRFTNVFAAGEVMAGNILRRGYLAGFGMTIGTVFGRIAGDGAAQYVRG